VIPSPKDAESYPRRKELKATQLQKPQNTMLFSTEHFITFSVITNIYNKKTKGPTLMEFFTATGKLKKFFFDN